MRKENLTKSMLERFCEDQEAMQSLLDVVNPTIDSYTYYSMKDKLGTVLRIERDYETDVIELEVGDASQYASVLLSPEEVKTLSFGIDISVNYPRLATQPFTIKDGDEGDVIISGRNVNGVFQINLYDGDGNVPLLFNERSALALRDLLYDLIG